jgi:CHAD domain-containing protein
MNDRATKLLRERSQMVFRALPKALAGEEEPLHQMRVAGRRLRVALPIVSQKPQGQRVRRAARLLRDLTRVAGTSRDLDVSAALFDARVKEMGPVSSTLRSLRKRLRLARNKSRAQMAEALLDLDIAELRRQLRAIEARKGESLFAVLHRLRQERERQGEELLRALDAVGDRYDPEALHGVRIESRKLRYLLELGDDLKGVTSAGPRLLKEIQGQLGQIHDDHVLAQWFATQAARAADRGEGDLEMEAARQEALSLEQCRRHHQEFLAANPTARIREALNLVDRGALLAPHFEPFLGSPSAER